MGEHRKTLFRALEKSDLSMLRAVLAKGEPAAFMAGDRMPPVMEAINCNRNDLEILDELVRAGAEVTQCFPYGSDSILHWVTGRETSAVLYWCLEHGADIHANDKNGWTPLFSAVRVAKDCDSDPAIQECGLRDIDVLLGAGADVAHRDQQGKTALHYAAEAGALRVVCLLLDHGVPVGVRDMTGITALMLVAERGHDAVVSLLLSRGALAGAADADGETALHMIASLYPDCFKSGHMAVAELLIGAGASANSLNRHGFPPIYHCAGSGNVEMVRFLLRNGADPNGGDGAILQNAVFFEYDDIVALLLVSGADAGFAYGKERRTPLHVAAHEGYLFGTAMLPEHGALIDAADIDGETPLMVAVRRQHIDIVQALLDRGADIRRADHYGNTPLSLARRRGDAELTALIESQL